MASCTGVKIAVVLAGAVAKGAWEAGALHTLARTDLEIVRIVASSAGALNGTMLAAAVRARDLAGGAERLVALWRDRADWHEVFHASWSNIAARRALSDRARVLALLRSEIPPLAVPSPAEIQLRLLVAPLAGQRGVIGDTTATTYEAVLDFTAADFATEAGLARVFDAATASSAFPLIFAPVEVDGLGACVDGGAVNNTPVKWALDADVDAIVVIATTPAERQSPPAGLRGLALASHLADMLIGERLFRDLHEAADVNRALAALAALDLSDAQRAGVLAALGWTGRRQLQLIQIRPREDLTGSSFSGFFDAALRAAYLADGAARAAEVLGYKLQ